MDGHRFDEVARRWATRTERRRAVQLAVVGLAALLRPRGDKGTVSAQEASASCSQDADCAPDDLDPCTGAACIDGACSVFVVDCVPGYACCGNGACCPTGGAATCTAAADCLGPAADPCVGARCDDGVCAPLVSVLCAPGFACCGNGACCPTGGGCATDADCLPWGADPRVQARCIGGACVPAGRVPA